MTKDDNGTTVRFIDACCFVCHEKNTGPGEGIDFVGLGDIKDHLVFPFDALDPGFWVICEWVEKTFFRG
jgi:hypothetical protein